MGLPTSRMRWYPKHTSAHVGATDPVIWLRLRSRNRARGRLRRAAGKLPRRLSWMTTSWGGSHVGWVARDVHESA